MEGGLESKMGKFAHKRGITLDETLTSVQRLPAFSRPLPQRRDKNASLAL
jgi:hypothetical protein